MSNKSVTRIEREPEGLPALFSKLADDLTTLLDTKLTLLKVELKEEFDAYIRGVVMILIGAVVAIVGFALLNVALAFLMSLLFANTSFSQPAQYAFGFIITALIYLIIGGLTIAVTKNRLAKQGLVPKRTVKELERDKEWLQKEI